MAGNTRIRITGALLLGVIAITMTMGGIIYRLPREKVSADTNHIRLMKNRIDFLVVVGIIASFGARMQRPGHTIGAQLRALRSKCVPSLQEHVRHFEEEWASFVAGSEDAISREHTLWRSSHS
ncbi:hypothetical protein AB0C21_42785 [Spirillospora sp. NPDC049024]